MNSDVYHDLIAGREGMLKIADRALFFMTGEDRVRYLNGQFTNDLSKLTMGHSQYGAVLTGKGKIVSDLFVSSSHEGLWIDAPLVNREIVRQRLEKFIIADDAILEDSTDKFQLHHFFGSTTDSAHSFKNPRFGLPGIDLWVPYDKKPEKPTTQLVEAVVTEMLRIEHALGKWGNEIDENTLPQEVGLERYGLSYDKGCYVGQETVARIRSLGHVNRSMAFFELISGPHPYLPCNLMDGALLAGKLTSLSFSPGFQQTFALGLVNRKYNQVGQSLMAGDTLLTIAAPARKIS